MVKFKDTASRITPGSRNITIDGVRIDGTRLVDEDGDIVQALVSALPDPESEFTIRIKIELPDEDEQ